MQDRRFYQQNWEMDGCLPANRITNADYLLAPDERTISDSPCRQLVDRSDVSNPTPGRHRAAPAGAPLFEENPHVRQDS
jgi:hypothetical protein